MTSGSQLAHLDNFENANKIGPSKSFGAKFLASTFGWLFGEFKRFQVFWIVFGFWVVATIAVSTAIGDPMLPAVMKYALRIVRALILLASVLSLSVAISFLYMKDDSLSITIARFRSYLGKNTAFFRILVATVSFALFMGCFLFWKMRIPLIQPFVWDNTFANWDEALLSGRAAYEVFLPLMFRPLVTQAIDFIYGFWAVICALFWIGLYAWKSGSTHLRDTYWLATLFAWLIIGLFAATAFSSVGPVYYQHFNPDIERFQPLLAHLATYDVGHIPQETLWGETRGLAATTAHEYLWTIYQGNAALPGGISAMPSMHNAQAMIFVLAAFKINRKLGYVMLAFLAVTFVGSVVLAWHYMVDAFIAYALVVPLWYLASWMAPSNPAKAMQ